MDPPFSDSSAGRPLAAKGQQRLSGERPVVEKLPEMMGHLTVGRWEYPIFQS